MHSFTSYIRYLPKRTIGIFLGLLSAVLISSAVLAGFGPQRPTKVYESDNTSFDYITFNSITDTPYYGNEQDFLRAHISTQDAPSSTRVADVGHADVITISAYFHNNASPDISQGGVATDVTINVDVPNGISSEHQIDGYISAGPDAVPLRIWDTTTIASQRDFSLEYVPGSAKITTNHFTADLSDNIITDGVLIGDDQLDGNVAPGFDNTGWVTFQVAVTQAELPMPNFTVEKHVRDQGVAEWSETATVEPGSTVEYRVSINNTGNTRLESIQVNEYIPEEVSYINGSAKLNGTSISDIDNVGLSISSLEVDGTHQLTYQARIAPAETLKCGNNQIDSQVSIKPAGFEQAKTDASTLTVHRSCVEPNPVFDCQLVLLVTDVQARSVSASIEMTMSDDVSVENAKIDFGDDTIVHTGSAEYTYSQAGVYVVRGIVSFDVAHERKNVVCSDTVEFIDQVVLVSVCRAGEMITIDKNDRISTDTDSCPPPSTPEPDPQPRVISVCRVGDVIEIEDTDLRNSDIIGSTCPDASGEVNGTTTEVVATLPNTGMSATTIVLNVVGTISIIAAVHGYLSSRRTM